MAGNGSAIGILNNNIYTRELSNQKPEAAEQWGIYRRYNIYRFVFESEKALRVKLKPTIARTANSAKENKNNLAILPWRGLSYLGAKCFHISLGRLLCRFGRLSHLVSAVISVDCRCHSVNNI